MPLLDLSQATVALQRLLELNIPQIEPTLGGGALTISTLPPERVQGAANVLSLYCYHVSADPSNRFRPREPSGQQPIATSPLTLNLNYILTAHTVVGNDFNALEEQRLLGYAMKTFHDHPVVDDSTRIVGQLVLPDEIRGQNNRFSITMLQLTPGEALNFWANENQTTVKPSCYYEVSAAEIQPQPPERIPGIVLQVGSYVLPKNTPAIAATVSEVPYLRSAGMGGGAASLTASPARVGPAVAVPPPPNILRLTGRAFAAGQAQALHLTHPLWARRLAGGPVPVDLALNAGLGWAIAVTDDEVEITMGNTLRAADPAGGPAVDLELYPGTYLASWSIDRQFERDSGSFVLPDHSNTCPFLIYPRITGSVRDNATGRVTLDFGGDWLLTRGRPLPADPAAEPELDIRLSVDSRAYQLVPGPQPAGPGTFVIADHALTYEPFAEADTPGEHAIRVVIDGADSQPFWITIP